VTPVPTAGPIGPKTVGSVGQAGTAGGLVKAGRGKNEQLLPGEVPGNGGLGKTVVVEAGAKIRAPVGSIAGTRTLAQPVSQALANRIRAVFLSVAEIHMRNRVSPRGRKETLRENVACLLATCGE